MRTRPAEGAGVGTTGAAKAAAGAHRAAAGATPMSLDAAVAQGNAVFEARRASTVTR
jgi:hypothetical protein